MARVEQELRKIATFDPIGAFEKVGGRGDSVRFRVRDIGAMPSEVRACIARMRVKLEKRPGSKADDEPDQILEIWFWDKMKALELCAKHFGWVSTKATVLVGKELRELLEEGRRRNAAFRQGAIDVTPQRRALPDPTTAPEPVFHVEPTISAPVATESTPEPDDEGALVI